MYDLSLWFIMAKTLVLGYGSPFGQFQKTHKGESDS